MIRLLVCLFALLALSPAPALAQSDDADLAGPPECLDDNHANRCDAEVQARTRALLGIASIEDEAATGAVIYRAFFVNGYGRDMPAVAFERRPGQSPEVVIYGREGRSTRAPVSAAVWERVVREARLADRVLTPAPRPGNAGPGDVQSISICMHSWVQTVELANAPRSRSADEPVRRRTEDACDGGLTTAYAFVLAELAVQSLPWCDRIDPQTERNNVTQLETCLTFTGDRMAAADLYVERLADDYRWMQDEHLDIAAVRAGLGVNGALTLTWGDQTVQATDWMDRAPATFILARLTEHPHIRFWPRTIEGESPQRIVVRGVAESSQDDVRLDAAYTQTWVWHDNSLSWGLSEWTVETFTPVPEPE